MILMRKSRYKTKLEPIKRSGLSNNVKDYLSVEKISIRDIEEQLSPKLKDTVSMHQSGNSNLLNLRDVKATVKEFLPVIKPNQAPPPKKKFSPPYETYYYRDFVWRCGFSSGTIVEVPNPGEYPFKVKFFLGRGNNSRLIRGLVLRRPWYQITDKIEDAHVAWTQIKSSYFMPMQKNTKIVKDP